MNKDSSTVKQKAIMQDSGFTLVELLVVLAILGLLVAIGTPQVLRYLSSAKVDAAKTQISNFESALELYFIDNGAYPNEQQGLSALVQKPSGTQSWNGPYIKLKGEILDPWGNPYLYEYDASKTTVLISSFGADGAVGGEGVNADINK